MFYVALTRAKRQLTLSTIVNKRKKPSPFLDDFLMNPQIQKLDAVQSAPKVQVPAVGGDRRAGSRFERSGAALSARQRAIRGRIRASRCGPRRFIRRAPNRCN